MNKAILPKFARPLRYEIKLDVDLPNFKYTGSQTVDLEIIKDTDSFEVNGIDIEITEAYLLDSDGSQIDLDFKYLKELERISFSTESKLTLGNYSLKLKFNSLITNDLKGFYKSQFLDLNDNEKWLATTQFEPTSARNAFPCWDEPEYKAVFSMTLISDKKYLRISNEKVLEENELSNGKVETKFVDSMIMSTYLVAFVIGELEVTEIGSVGTTQIRIIHRPGFSHQTNFAGKAGMKILEFFENYYQIPYPGSKLDLIAIPDFAMGAMENVGAVTFRESLLLIDEAKATRQELSRSVSVIAHELAHMWFGDLVTMKWWDGIWLNEAFASLMEAIAANGTYPEFEQWSEMNLSRSAGFGVDSLKNSRPVEFEVETPEQAEEMFDVLTYEKGVFMLGWEPRTFKFMREEDGSTRKLEQIRQDGELCPSVRELAEQEPAISLLDGLTVLSHRIGIIKSLLDTQVDGYVQATVAGITNTFRFRHARPCVNLPAVDRPYGKEIRGVLTSPDGNLLCGADMTSLEDTTKRHYMKPLDPDYVEEMSKDGFDPHLDLAKHAGDVTQDDIDKHNSGERSLKALRKNYKVVNYSATYGVGSQTLSRNSGMPVDKAQTLLDAFWSRNWAIEKVSKDARTRDLFGSKWIYNPVSRFWYSLRSDKDRFSTLNQSTGVYCFDTWVTYCRSLELKTIGQFHDEVIVLLEEGKEVETKRKMEAAIDLVNQELQLNVPLGIDVQFGKTYAEIH